VYPYAQTTISLAYVAKTPLIFGIKFAIFKSYFNLIALKYQPNKRAEYIENKENNYICILAIIKKVTL
jgi:hypothetical protein